MTPTLADFQALLPFSKAIEAWQVDAYVQRARTLDVLPLVPAAALELCEALPEAEEPAAWPVALPQVQTGKLVTRQERVFQALVSAPALEPPVYALSTSEWSYDPLRTLWFEYLRPYWVHAAYARLLVQHGVNVTKSGITNPTDPQGTYVPASGAQRASLQADADNTAAALRNRLTRFLAATSPRADEPCHRTPYRRSSRLRGV